MSEEVCIWRVTIRGEGGKPQVIELEAASRADIFRQLDAQHLLVIKVEKSSGIIRKRNWERMPLWFITLIIFGVTAVLVAAYLLVTSTSRHQRQHIQQNKIDSVSVATNAPVKKVKRSAVVDAIARNPRVTDALAELSDSFERCEVPQAKKPVVLSKYGKPIFNSGTEQLISLVFTTEIGEFPMPLPHISDKDRENIVAILLSKNEILKDDSESAKFCKSTVDLAKKEIIEFIKEGGDPDEFLQFYNRELIKAFEYRNAARRQAQEILEDEPDLADDFLSAINERFDKDGIKHLTKEDLE